MCIVFTCGEHTFRREVEGYEGIVCRCFNCGNYSGSVIKTHPWFTFCFVPVVPLSLHGYEDVQCRICNFAQPLDTREDVRAMRYGGQGPPGTQLPPMAHGALGSGPPGAGTPGAGAPGPNGAPGAGPPGPQTQPYSAQGGMHYA